MRNMLSVGMLTAAAVSFGLGAADAAPVSSVMLNSPTPLTALPTLATSSEIQAMIARARSSIKPGAPLLLQPLLRVASYTAFLEYRRGPWSMAVHDDDELFFVVQGSGTFVFGGTLQKAGAETTIAGGTTQHVRAGDFFVAPAHTPHGFPEVDGELVLITMHIPIDSKAAPPAGH